jgi:ABC-type enterochelin transport system substrate-binding protein
MSSENKPDWKILSSQIQQFYQFFSKLTPSQLSQIKLKQEIVQEFKKFMDKLLQIFSKRHFA